MKIEVDVASGWRPTDPRPYDLEVRHDERRAASASPAKRKDSRSKPQRVRALRVMRRYGVPPQLAFDAWLDPAVARLWLFATASRPLEYVAIDAHVGLIPLGGSGKPRRYRSLQRRIHRNRPAPATRLHPVRGKIRVRQYPRRGRDRAA